MYLYVCKNSHIYIYIYILKDIGQNYMKIVFIKYIFIKYIAFINSLYINNILTTYKILLKCCI